MRFIVTLVECFFCTFGANVLGIFVLKNKISTEQKLWNICSRGTKVPQRRKFQGANVPQNKSFTKVVAVDFLLPGMKVLGNEKSIIHLSIRELQFITASCVLPLRRASRATAH